MADGADKLPQSSVLGQYCHSQEWSPHDLMDDVEENIYSKCCHSNKIPELWTLITMQFSIPCAERKESFLKEPTFT